MPGAGAVSGRLPVERVRHYAPRTDIVCEGDPPRAVRVVISGWVCRYKQLPDGRRQIQALLLPGDVCDGHDGLEGMDHTIGALSKVVLGEIDPRPTRRRCDRTIQSDGLYGGWRPWRSQSSASGPSTSHGGTRGRGWRTCSASCTTGWTWSGLVDAGGYDMPLTPARAGRCARWDVGACQSHLTGDARGRFGDAEEAASDDPKPRRSAEGRVVRPGLPAPVHVDGDGHSACVTEKRIATTIIIFDRNSIQINVAAFGPWDVKRSDAADR